MNFKKLRCKKEYGEWYYTSSKEWNDGWVTMIYTLYDNNKNFVNEFWGYSEMKEYVENDCKHL